MDLNSENSCRQYLQSQNPLTIATQIRRDQDSCRDQKLPTLLALYLPPVKSEQASAIALHLSPETARYGRSIGLAQYQGIIQGIKEYLAQMTPAKREDLPGVKMKGKKPSKEDIQTALDVLDFYHKSRYFKEIHLKTPLEDIVYLLQNESRAPDRKADETSPPEETNFSKININRKCYICRFLLISHHPQYPSLCKPCGNFNLASSNLSLTGKLNLAGKTALVTGARINLGYHTALRMLQCGAKVIATTRYPRDAHVRYVAEADSSTWSQNLRIIGADFRSAADVFEMIRVAKDCLKAWSGNEKVKLDILINNAAQTLTDPLETERAAVKKEYQLSLESSDAKMVLCDSNYEARIRGVGQGSKSLGFEANQLDKTLSVHKMQTHNIKQDLSPTNSTDQEISIIAEANPKSSWMQTISQIPYEDIISAHSVNTFVPLILTREFLPIMGNPHHHHQQQSPSSPSPNPNPNPNPKFTTLAHIINVSSREGIFETQHASQTSFSSKNGHHVHTNLTKAALNMLTETEAGPAWRERRVAINTVDPGYMSAAPEIERGWRESGRAECPIGWEDGAGRVLWVVAVAAGVGVEGKGGSAPVWGRFLKHFGRVEVDVGVGR